MSAIIDDEDWHPLTASYPHVELSRESFALFLEERASSLHLEDLFLACAASRGDAAAIGLVEEQHFAALRSAMGWVGARTSDLDDLLQGIREKLFSAPSGKRPKIGEYTGRAPLAAWLRVVAIHHARSAGRKRTEMPVDDGLELLPAEGAGADPELAYLRNTFRDVFQSAFETAVASLSAEDRNVLRYHYIDGLTIDQVGAIYGLHRVSASRRIRKARALLVERTRAELRRTYFASSSELESVLRAVESEVELSIRALFGATREP